MSAPGPAPTALPAAAASPKQAQVAVPVLGSAPPPPFFSQTDQYQAAKYFTFIFFGLSVFVILLFGGFVVCHCYRRLRYAQEHPSGPQAGQAPGVPASGQQGHIEIPVKQGFVVQNPDGGIYVAYIPDSPHAKPDPAAKAFPRSPSRVGGLPGSAAGSTGSNGAGSPSSGDSSTTPGTSSTPGGRRGVGGDSSRSLGSSSSEGSSRGGRRAWPRMIFGSPAAAQGSRGAEDIESQVPQQQPADTAWRQRQAGLFHMF